MGQEISVNIYPGEGRGAFKFKITLVVEVREKSVISLEFFNYSNLIIVFHDKQPRFVYVFYTYINDWHGTKSDH